MNKKYLYIGGAVLIVGFIGLVIFDSYNLTKTGVNNDGDNPFQNTTGVTPTPTKVVPTPLQQPYFFQKSDEYEVSARSFNPEDRTVEINVKEIKTGKVQEIQGRVKFFGSVNNYYTVSKKYMVLVSGTYTTRSGVLVSLEQGRILKSDLTFVGEKMTIYKDYLIYDTIYDGSADMLMPSTTVAYYNILTGNNVVVFQPKTKEDYSIKSLDDGVLEVTHTYYTNPQDTTTLKTETLKKDLTAELK